MYVPWATVLLTIAITGPINLSSGFYIKTAADIAGATTSHNHHNAQMVDKWSFIKNKLGLTNQKVKLLQSQKDQAATWNLLNRYIEESPNYNHNNKAKAKKVSNSEPATQFSKIYHNVIQQLKQSRSTFRTSLKFELSDKPLSSLKRSPRKISVNMVSDIPSQKIDDLLRIFNEKYGLNDEDRNDDYSSEADVDSATNSDDKQEYLYDDEEDQAIPAKSNHNPQYGSFQDLILQATRNQWQRELEETKLQNRSEHFV